MDSGNWPSYETEYNETMSPISPLALENSQNRKIEESGFSNVSGSWNLSKIHSFGLGGRVV